MYRMLFGIHAMSAVLAMGSTRDPCAFQRPPCGVVPSRAARRNSRCASSTNRNLFPGDPASSSVSTQRWSSTGVWSSSGERCRTQSGLLAAGAPQPSRRYYHRYYYYLPFLRQSRRGRSNRVIRVIAAAGSDDGANEGTASGSRAGEAAGVVEPSAVGAADAGVGRGGGVTGKEGGSSTAEAGVTQEAKRPPRKRFSGLLADRFQHPFDLEATAMLRRLPGLELAIRSAVPAIEDAVYMENIANSILVGPRQMPSLYKLLVEACRVLDMDVPDMYIRQNPQPNAYTLAIRGKKPFIVLHTSLVDLMEPEEVQAVIAHELGHLKCEHGIWVTLATVLANGLYRGGFLGAFLADRLGLRRSIMRWSRAAEFTCDRAAMLVAQDVNIVVSTLLKLAGGSVSQASELSVPEFLKQASAYELASQSRIGRLLRNSQSMELTHPLPVIRARELVNFSKSSQYLGLVRRGSPL